MMPFGATSYNVLGTFDDSTAQFVAFDERVRCYRRRSRQTNPGNAKKVVKENCAFKQCDGPRRDNDVDHRQNSSNFGEICDPQSVGSDRACEDRSC
jgi:hypothetical protein